MKKYALFIMLLCFSILPLTGCKPVFQHKIDKYRQVELTKEDLENDSYYVKDGTRFVKVYKADVKNAVNLNGNRQRITFLTADYKTVPTLYKSEILAIPSEKTEVKEISLVRYKEIGYSLGFYGLQEDEDGYFVGKLNENVYKNSGAYSLISDGKSEYFRIVSINDEPVSMDMLSDTGAFNCLEKNENYNVSYYAGTYFTTSVMEADTFSLEEYEYYTLSDMSDTKNGYISFRMPEDAKSGWYYIGNAGLFRYVAYDKGIDLSEVEMNEPYYSSLEEQQAAYSQKFSTTFDTRLNNVTISFDYEPASLMEGTLTGTVFSPDGTAYEMVVDEDNRKIYCALEEAMAGKWYIYIQPKEAVITNMAVISNKEEQEITEEDFVIKIEEGQIHYRIVVSYKGSGKIYAVLVDGNKEIQNFELNEKANKLYYDASYLGEGEYTVKVYHYTDTAIEDVYTEENTVTDSDIITVTQ